MKRRSVQVRLTLWYTLLMAGMAGLLLVFLLVISGAVSRQTAMDQLETTLWENLSQVSLGDDGSLQLGEDFSFYQNGVYTLVYSQSQALLAGQVPVSFTASEPFQNGQTAPWTGRGASTTSWTSGCPRGGRAACGSGVSWRLRRTPRPSPTWCSSPW